MINLLLSPVARYAILCAAILMIALGIYGKIRSDAIASIEAEAIADALRRTQNAVRAGDSVDTSPDGLLKTDGFRRD